MEKESHITYLLYYDALLTLNRSITQSVNTPFRKQTETKTCRTDLDLKLRFINDGTVV